MRIVYAGTPEYAVPSLRALAASGHELVGVITREAAPLGRKRTLTPSPVALAAADLGIDTLATNRLGEEATEWVSDRAPDLGVIVAYGGLVREPLLSLPPLGWINLHFSELPRWRGAAPVQRALMAGEQHLGVTVFRLVPELDAGAVLTRDGMTFAAGTTAGAALTELSHFGTDVLLAAVDLLAEQPTAGSAQSGHATYAHKLARADGRIDVLGSTAEAALAHWAGVTPEPGAFAMLGDQPVKLIELAAWAGERPRDLARGEVRFVEKRAVLGLRDGELEIRQVQPAGKPIMDGSAWLRGRDGFAVLS